MRKHMIFVCLSLAASQLIFSQDNKMSSGKPSIGKSSFIAELGGPGIVFSANYDTRFKQSRLEWAEGLVLGSSAVGKTLMTR